MFTHVGMIGYIKSKDSGLHIRKRDVSLHTMTEEGTKASDTFMTIVQTAKKLGVSAYEYFNDRVSKSYKMISLAELIEDKRSSVFNYND